MIFITHDDGEMVERAAENLTANDAHASADNLSRSQVCRYRALVGNQGRRMK